MMQFSLIVSFEETTGALKVRPVLVVSDYTRKSVETLVLVIVGVILCVSIKLLIRHRPHRL
jgi:hypothetical protein